MASPPGSILLEKLLKQSSSSAYPLAQEAFLSPEESEQLISLINVDRRANLHAAIEVNNVGIHHPDAAG
jgi:hypothetical protein